MPYVATHISAALQPRAMLALLGGTYVLALAPPLSAIVFAATSGSAVSAWLGGLVLGGQEEALESFQKSLLGSLQDQMLLLWKALEPDPVDLAALPGALRGRMVAADGSARVEVLPREDLNDDEALARFVDGVRAVAPQTTGSAVSILEWSRATVRSGRVARSSVSDSVTGFQFASHTSSTFGRRMLEGSVATTRPISPELI